MFPGTVQSGLTLTKVLGGIGKTLNVANQLIPIYMQAKPLIANAKSTFSVAKELLNTPKTSNKTKITPVNNNSTKKESTPILSNNNPVFFL